MAFNLSRLAQNGTNLGSFKIRTDLKYPRYVRVYVNLAELIAKHDVPASLVVLLGKKQRHNMLHVEIWLGEGDKTIGSRWNNGKVGVFDSYKFNPKSFVNEVYIFKSIDTWLMGICHRSEVKQYRIVTFGTKESQISPKLDKSGPICPTLDSNLASMLLLISQC